MYRESPIVMEPYARATLTIACDGRASCLCLRAASDVTTQVYSQFRGCCRKEFRCHFPNIAVYYWQHLHLRCSILIKY